MFKIDKNLLILDNPIVLDDYTIENFDLNKINDTNEVFLGRYKIIYEDKKYKIDDKCKYRFNRDSFNYINIKYKIIYEDENVYLIFNIIFSSDIASISSTKENKHTDKIKINLEKYFKEIIFKVINNEKISITKTQVIKNIIQKEKERIFKEFLLNGIYILLDYEYKTNVEIYKYIDNKKNITSISNRILFYNNPAMLIFCECITNKKIFSENDVYNIRIQIDEEHELVFANVDLTQNLICGVDYYIFNLLGNYTISLNYKYDKYLEIKQKTLKYLDYETVLIDDDGFEYKNYFSLILSHLSKYLYNNNEEFVIKKYMKTNKIKNICNIDVNNYLLFKGMI